SRVHRDPDDGQDADHRDRQEHTHPALVAARPGFHRHVRTHRRSRLPFRIHRGSGSSLLWFIAVPREIHCRSRKIHCRSRKISTGDTNVEVSTRLSGMNGRNLTSTNDTSQVTVTDTKT